MASDAGQGGFETLDRDATRRTRLAAERTQLAWWRTGLTALAVGIGVGRILPELSGAATEWPYVLLGIAFAIYGVAMIVFGNARGQALDEALAHGQYRGPGERATAALAAAGVGLGIATCLLIALA